MRTNFFLAFVLILLGSFAYWYEFRQKPQVEKKQETAKKLFVADPDREVGKVSVRFAEKDKDYGVEVECRENCRLSDANAKWEIVSPIRFKADEGNVGSFLTSLGSAAASETIALEGDREAALAKYGLGKDRRDGRRVEISFKASGKQPAGKLSVHVGDDAAVEGSFYAYVEENGVPSAQVRMLPSYAKSNLQRSLSYWRAKRLFQFAQSQVERIRLENDSGKTEIVKEGSEWRFADGRPADNETIDVFLTGLVYLNAQEYVSDDKARDRAKFRLPAKPKYRLAVRVAAPKGAPKGQPEKEPAAAAPASEATLEVFEGTVNKAKKMFGIVGDRGFIVELDRLATDKFAKKPQEFFYRYFLTSQERAQVREVRAAFTGADKKRETAAFRSDDGRAWKPVSGAKAEGFDSDAVYEALNKLYGAKITEYSILKAPSPGYAERSAWELRDAKGTLLRAITLYAGEGGKPDSLVKLSGQGGGRVAALGKLEKAHAAAIPGSLAAFRVEPVASGKQAAAAGK